MGNINPVLFLNDEEDDGNDAVNLRVHRRQLRDNLDPFDIPETEFIRIYRLDKAAAVDLINLLEPLMPNSYRRHGIEHHLKVLGALNFFASGSYQRRTGNDFSACMSQSMISRSITHITDAINAHLLDDFVKFPMTERAMNEAKQDFFEVSNFDGIIGAVDGTQVNLVRPTVNEHAYLNRKGNHSLNVMIVCLQNLLITAVNPRYPGSCHDSFVWKGSWLRRSLMDLFERGRRDFWLIGDSGYPLEPWLLNPIVNAPEGTPQHRYTQAHKKARNCVERSIGVLKCRFRCLLKHRTLHYSPTRAAKIVNSCVVLHNICISRNIDLIEDDEDDDDDGDSDESEDDDGHHQNGIGNANIGNNVFIIGNQTRNDVIHQQFL